MRAWMGVVAALAVGVVAGPAVADSLLTEGDAAPVFMLNAYNEDVASAATGSTHPSLGNFLGVSPEQPRDAVLLVFLRGSGDVADQLDVLTRVQRKFADRGQGLQVVAVCIDSQAGDIRAALDTARTVNFPVLRDRFQVVADRYGVTAERAPVAFLLVGQRPDVALKPSEQAAIKEAYFSHEYDWQIQIAQRWTGSLATQEASLNQALDSVMPM